MSDCVNVEMREALPDLLNGRLDAAARARIEAHVLTCPGCAAELETLHSVRAAFSVNAGVSPIDVQRIVSLLPRPDAGVGARAIARTDARTDATRRIRPWVDWRIAAALTTITIGGLSVVVAKRSSSVDGLPPARVDTPTVVPVARARPVPDTAGRGRVIAPAPAVREPRSQLSFGGGVRDLETADIEALLGALDEIDAAPVAPAVEPDSSPLLPVVTGETR